ncbi:MAG: hypothetical protein FIB06_01475 [Betaproteobacteria bacterium]|nr:hypothetical protein [Betaproteobacteria bacterium]
MTRSTATSAPIPEARYQAWLAHVFDRPPTPSGWYFDVDDPNFPGSAGEIVALTARTLTRCGDDLISFTDVQVAHGLSYLFNNACSDTVFAFIDDDVPATDRLAAISAIRWLYRDCLAVRCAPVLGHCDEAGANPLNGFCYMLWDTTPLAWWEGRPEKDRWYEALADVLEYALTIANPACIESALHGLGHLHPVAPDRVGRAIARFLAAADHLPERLRNYARQAATGCIL